LETRRLELSRVNLNTILQEAFDVAKTHESSHERQFNLQIPQAPWPLPEIVADEDLLFLAIHNLFDNAIKFSTSGDTIELRASENGDHVVIEIADTGPGIPEEEISQVWTELYRGEKARGIPGSGLGLALVDAIIARHQGEVAMRSRPGQGTVVTLRLPIRGVTNQ
jgi:two-component system OmpR family sensor kinase